MAVLRIVTAYHVQRVCMLLHLVFGIYTVVCIGCSGKELIFDQGGPQQTRGWI